MCGTDISRYCNLAKLLQKSISGWSPGKNKGTVKQPTHYVGYAAYTNLSDRKESWERRAEMAEGR